MLYHGIGEKIVAGNAAVFIRALAEQQIDLPGFGGGRVTADPEAGCLHQHLCAPLEEQAVIAGPIQVLAQSIGHVSGDVDLAAPDVPAFTLLGAVIRHHPRVAGPGAIHPRRMRSGLGKRADPEARQTAGSLWIGQVIKGRQKEICVPKIAAFVPRVGEPSSPDAHGVVPRRAVGRQLVDHITQRRLRVVIPLHDNVAVRPLLLPCGLILRQRTYKVPAWLHIQLEQGIHIAAGSQPGGDLQGDGSIGSVTGAAHSHAVTGICNKSGG